MAHKTPLLSKLAARLSVEFLILYFCIRLSLKVVWSAHRKRLLRNRWLLFYRFLLLLGTASLRHCGQRQSLSFAQDRVIVSMHIQLLDRALWFIAECRFQTLQPVSHKINPQRTPLEQASQRNDLKRACSLFLNALIHYSAVTIWAYMWPRNGHSSRSALHNRGTKIYYLWRKWKRHTGVAPLPGNFN